MNLGTLATSTLVAYASSFGVTAVVMDETNRTLFTESCSHLICEFMPSALPSNLSTVAGAGICGGGGGSGNQDGPAASAQFNFGCSQGSGAALAAWGESLLVVDYSNSLVRRLQCDSPSPTPSPSPITATPYPTPAASQSSSPSLCLSATPSSAGTASPSPATPPLSRSSSPPPPVRPPSAQILCEMEIHLITPT